MPQFLHQSAFVKWVRRMFYAGVNTDIRSEMMKDGLGSDALNMRPSSLDGNTGAMEAVQGEESLYPPDGGLINPDSYECIGRAYSNGHSVEFWCSNQANTPNPGDNPPYVRIDGAIAAQSPNIPYIFDRPLQIAVVEDCGERQGVLYPADHYSDPLFWDIKDMQDALNAGLLTYFDAYTVAQNSVGLNAPPTIPMPKYPDCIVDMGSTVGLPVGQYSYYIRYVTLNGDRTNWSPATGLIPVPSIYTPNNVDPAKNYPRTIGGDPNPLVPSQYGIVIEYRVDNLLGYASIEIGRTSFNATSNIAAVEVKEIVARINVAPGEVSIREFLDPSDANIVPAEVIPPDESIVQLLNIKAPKGVDYSDGRLKYANFMLEAKDIALTFLDFAGKKMTAITKALRRSVGGVTVPDGYDNPYNCAVNKSAQRGGQAKYAIQFWDGAYGLYPAVNIPEPFTAGTDIFPFPQRRDIKGVNGNWGVESDTFSDDPCFGGTVDVATVPQTAEGPVGKTFEVFTGGEQTKTDTERVVNVAKPNDGAVGRVGDYFPGLGSGTGQFFTYGFSLPPQVEEYSGIFDVIRPTGNGYQPWDPRNNQAETSGFNVPPNTSRFMGVSSAGGAFAFDETPSAFYADQCSASNPDSNAGRCFNPTHHALGTLIAGVDSGIPSGARIMSVVYNGDTRGEIVAQGFGSWDLFNTPTTSNPTTISNFDPARKSTNSLRTWFPDAAAGIIDQALWEDIQQFPGNYQVRFVSPLPFYPEIYSYRSSRLTVPTDLWSGPGVMANLMDVMCHTSFLHDEGQVNVGITPVEGYQPIPGNAPNGSWVGFDKWRRSADMDGDPPGDPGYDPNAYSYWQQQANGDPALFGQAGNALFQLSLFQPRTTGRTTYYLLQTSQSIYPPATDTVNFNTFVNSDPTRNFQGPWYVINIIRVGSTIPETNIEPYKNMGCHIALDQTIGVYEGNLQSFRLIGEREHYDCTNFLPTDYRYAYVTDDTNGTRRWLCVTGNTQINVNAILIAILTFGSWTAPDGLPVYGLYDAVTDDTGRYIQFGNYPTVPAIGARINIRYDKTAPIRAFGHDVTVAPVTHAVKDEDATTEDLSNGNIGEMDVLAGLSFIHAGFGMNPRVFVPKTDSETDEHIYINFMGTIRQWSIMWSAESRVLPSMYVNGNSVQGAVADRLQYFPAQHYIMRPADGLDTSGFFDQYYVNDYPSEPSIYFWGGLRYLPGVNLAYARPPEVGFFGYPRAGIRYNEDYCTTIAASAQYNPTYTDSPGLRTFLVQNMKTLSDESGEIKVIATATYPGQAGQNQYALLERGVSRVLTNKNILTGASGEQVSTFVTSNYWGDEIRISRNIGCPDQLWRLYSKGYASAGAGYMDTFFWPDRNGWYRMRGDAIEDISRSKFSKKLLPILKELPAGYVPQMSAFFNAKHQEMWATISPYTSSGQSRPPVLVVHSAQTNEWLGEYSYRFDGFLNAGPDVLAMRNSGTWTLDEGYLINGAVREAYVTTPIVGDVGKFKEMVRWRVVGDKPDGMQLFDKDGVMMSDQNAAIQEAFAPGTGALWTKLYDGYEGQWWRVMTAYDPGRRLAQDVRFFVKIIYNTEGSKSVLAVENLLKNIR